MTGWWYTYPSEKYEFVSWDDDIPNIWKNNPNVPNHQPDDIVMLYILLRIIFTNQNCWRHQETRQHWHGRHSLQWSAPQLKPNGSFFMGSYCRAREIQIDRLKTVVNIPFFFSGFTVSTILLVVYRISHHPPSTLGVLVIPWWPWTEHVVSPILKGFPSREPNLPSPLNSIYSNDQMFIHVSFPMVYQVFSAIRP